MKPVNRTIVTLALVGASLAATKASAQERERGVTIAERPRPEVDALGVRAAGALWRPKLTLSEKYNDNIFAVDEDSTGDFITVIEPSFGGASDWNEHELNFQAFATIGRYAANESENYVDATVRTAGRLDVTRDTALNAVVQYARGHEERGSPNEVNGITPTVFEVPSVTATYTRDAKVSLGVEGAWRRFNFKDVRSTAGTINNDDRDRTEISGQARLGYELVPRHEAFVRAGVNTRPYDARRDDNGFARSSHGYEVVAGADMELTGITSLNAFAGYTSQDYEDRRLGTVSGPSFGGEFVWNGKLTTLTASVTRSIEQTIIAGASGFFATRSGISVDHELRRNLLLEGKAFVQTNNFEGIELDERRLGVSVAANYLMNRYIHTYIEYSHERRDAEQAGAVTRDFAENRVVLGVELDY